MDFSGGGLPIPAPRRAHPWKGAAASLSLLMGLATVWPSLWAVAEMPAPRTPVAALRAPEEGHREGSCRCLRCAGPSDCPCDHGKGGRGAVCGSSNDDRPLRAQESAPPAPSKVMCEVPHWTPSSELWTPRFEVAEAPTVEPLLKAVDKVPIASL